MVVQEEYFLYAKGSQKMELKLSSRFLDVKLNNGIITSLINVIGRSMYAENIIHICQSLETMAFINTVMQDYEEKVHMRLMAKRFNRIERQV